MPYKPLTNEQIARSWELWAQYVDPHNAHGRTYFESLTVEQRLDVMRSLGWEDDPPESEED